MHCHTLTDIQYADDSPIASNVQDLQNFSNCANEKCHKFGMEINCKTTIMRISKNNDAPGACVQLDGFSLKYVSSFKYLRSMMISDGRCQKELTTQVTIDKSAFSDRRVYSETSGSLLSCGSGYSNVTSTRYCSMGVNSGLYCKIIRPKSRLQKFLRRMKKISWTAKVRTEGVLRIT